MGHVEERLRVCVANDALPPRSAYRPGGHHAMPLPKVVACVVRRACGWVWTEGREAGRESGRSVARHRTDSSVEEATAQRRMNAAVIRRGVWRVATEERATTWSTRGRGVKKAGGHLQNLSWW
jgi:hypothetical protein